MNKYKIGTFLLSLIPLFASSQENFKTYTQKLPGASVTFDMVAIPDGKFMMGSLAEETGRKPDEGPLHEVKINAFWIGQKEMPWDIYELYVYKDYDVTVQMAGVDAITRPTKPYLDMTFGMGKEGYPAVGMTQYNALQFCKWLYDRTGIFYRLPTEAEWEYACRAGSTGSYSFGNDASKLDEYAWYAGNSKEKTQPAGTKKPSAWGLYDMHGNAAEWTEDQYIPDVYNQYNGKLADNPVAVPLKLYPHTIRGGSFQNKPEDLRSASRLASDPDWKRIDPQIPKSNWWFPEAPFVGIRVVRPLIPPSKEEIEKYYNRKPIADY
ncbi:formylglycine-generating enzyme family protein [Flavihumibacter sp. R14]|nr:formylglycine-generating enzyme family protein [Flavihumibacter soli]